MEIVLLSSIKSWDITSYTNFRLFVKKRLYKKNKDVLGEMEFGDRIAALQHTFEAVEQDYRQVLLSI